MKMTAGTGTITNYGQFINNCQAGQFPYHIPANSLSDVQLYINIGATKPDTVQYELIHTCGALAGTVETLAASDYVVAQDSNNNWYGVFKNFTGASPICFVIGITLTFEGESGDQIYFSEEYCIETSCKPLTLLRGCYGNLNNKISYDCEGVYFGKGSGDALGDTSVVYKHELLLRGVEVTLSAIKNSFKQGRTRNFRTEKEKIFQFWGERIPEWYLPEIDAVFYRGEVYVGSKKYLVNETAFELIEECSKQWMPAATFKESCYQSFSCEADPCAEPAVVCCDPVLVSVDVYEVPQESAFQEGVIVIECFVDDTPVITGTLDPVTGITGGSTTVTCDAFAGVRVIVMRGGLQIPGIDPGDGSTYYTKVIAENFITFSDPLVPGDSPEPGEFIYIQTIP